MGTMRVFVRESRLTPRLYFSFEILLTPHNFLPLCQEQFYNIIKCQDILPFKGFSISRYIMCKSLSLSFNKNAGQPNANLTYYDGMINLTYTDGDAYSRGPLRKSQITFLCQRNGNLFIKVNLCYFHRFFFTILTFNEREKVDSNYRLLKHESYHSLKLPMVIQNLLRNGMARTFSNG